MLYGFKNDIDHEVTDTRDFIRFRNDGDNPKNRARSMSVNDLYFSSESNHCKHSALYTCL